MYAVAGAVQVNIYAGAETVTTQIIISVMSGTVGFTTQTNIYAVAGIEYYTD